MRHYLYFAGKDSREFGIYISGSGTFNAPERDVEFVSVPGRSGDLTIDNGRFLNVTGTYPAFIHQNFTENAMKARLWLQSLTGYQRLEDTYHPDYYRMAVYRGPLDFETRALNSGADFDLSFECKPQRYLKSGEFPVQISAPGALYNPWMPSLPLITVYGSGAGVLSVGGYTVTIHDMTDSLTLDSETGNAYKGLSNENGNIYAPEFPVLQSGRNVVGWSGGISRVEITPRWWTV